MALNTNINGLHLMEDLEIINLMKVIYMSESNSPGPIHLNIPFEKPLNISKSEKRKTFDLFQKLYIDKIQGFNKEEKIYKNHEDSINKSNTINFYNEGIIIVGPYQGLEGDLIRFNEALEKLQHFTGWPIFADPVSGVDSNLRGLVTNWELIISNKEFLFSCNLLLRLGPMSSSNALEDFLRNFQGKQILIKESNSRKLDPTKKATEYDYGLYQFVKNNFSKKNDKFLKKKPLSPLALVLMDEGNRIKKIISDQLSKSSKNTEILLANSIPKFWPKNYPIMLSASSPIRDWLSFSENGSLTRRCFSFRGASGIDGTLSMALGIAQVSNPLLLVTGDLAFLHDINGWLIENARDLKLTILLIDNGGGNIFERLYKNNLEKEEMKKLFTTPKQVNWEELAGAYNIPFKSVENFKKIKEAFDWSLSMQKSVIIKVSIDVAYEIKERKIIFNKILKRKSI